MEGECCRTVENLRLRSPHISHAIVVLVLGLAFYSEDPNGVGESINVFLFPYMSPLAGSEAALLVLSFDAILGGGALISFSESILLMVKNQFDPVKNWKAAEKQLEAWGVFYHAFLGDAAVHPAIYKLYNLFKDTTYIGLKLRVQNQRQPTLPVALLRLLHTGFNKSFSQAMERQQQVHWPCFERLRRDLVTRNFCPEIISFPGALTSQAPVARDP